MPLRDDTGLQRFQAIGVSRVDPAKNVKCHRQVFRPLENLDDRFGAFDMGEVAEQGDVEDAEILQPWRDGDMVVQHRRRQQCDPVGELGNMRVKMSALVCDRRTVSICKTFTDETNAPGLRADGDVAGALKADVACLRRAIGNVAIMPFEADQRVDVADREIVVQAEDDLRPMCLNDMRQRKRKAQQMIDVNDVDCIL